MTILQTYIPQENTQLNFTSRSTLIATERTGRNAFLIELDALYCDVIVKRWEEYTGKKAMRTPTA